MLNKRDEDIDTAKHF